MVKLWEIKLPIFLGGELAARFEFTCIKYQTTCYLDETILRLYVREQREKKRTS
jgi:hypothetical protein